jgi:probable phosphoglycerate mutase
VTITRPQLVLVRHGETEWSRSGQHTSVTDLALTETGVRQAERLAVRLAVRLGAVPVAEALVLCSPRARARETCRIAGLADAASVEEDLAEWAYGDYEGLTSPQIHALDPAWSLWAAGAPGGEQPADVAARADRVIERCLGAARQTCVLFAHGHILRVIAAQWTELGVAAGGRLSLDTASVSELGWEHATRTIVSWDDTSHLAGL